jgi:hypothetical protein
VIALALNTNRFKSVIDLGPPADQKIQVEKFVDFWGKTKAELRRFKDGRINMVVGKK